MIATDRLATLPLFVGLPEAPVARLAAVAEERHLPTGAVLLRQNEEARTVYFLLSGALQVLVRFEGVGDLLMGVLRDPGTLEGWSAFRAPYRSTASLRAEQDCELLALPRDAFEELFAEDPGLGYEILKRVAVGVDERLEGALQFLENPCAELW